MSVSVSCIKIDYSRDELLTSAAKIMLRNRYMLESEGSPQEAFARAAAYGSDSEEMAQKIYDYASKLWFMFATPVLANGGTDRGLSISCFLNSIEDSREGITSHWSENTWLSSMGGGIGSYWGNLRSNGTATSKGSKSTGIIPFIKVVDSQMLAISQGSTRRGGCAVYLDVSHPEIEEFLHIRKPTGGDHNRKCLNLHHAVVIPDAFMELVEACTKDPEADDSWNLIDPHTKDVVRTVSAKKLWQELIDIRIQTGEPFFMFRDTTERGRPEIYKILGLEVDQSNLCTEIMLTTSPTRSAVCVLSSANAEKFDEWSKDPDFIYYLIRFLDNIIDCFVAKASELPGFEKAVYSVTRERSLGLGLMGFHSYLQSKNIPIDGPLAIGINEKIFSLMKSKATEATESLAKEKGACPDAIEAGFDNIRNTHLLAIAPNASSAILCGWTSPSGEPLRSNTFTQKIIDGSHQFKNKYLERLLEEKGQNTVDVWTSIVSQQGSVQHLTFLTDYEKDIFKTATEIDQRALVDLAAQRQKYICQAQSLNLFFESNSNIKDVHNCHLRAWKAGVKTLYYLRSSTARRAEDVSLSVSLEEMKEHIESMGVNTPEEQDFDTCFMCEG